MREVGHILPSHSLPTSIYQVYLHKPQLRFVEIQRDTNKYLKLKILGVILMA